MSTKLALFAGQEVAVELLETVGGGFFDKKYSYTNTKNYSDIGNVKTNVSVTQWGNENSATGAGAIGVTFG